MQQLSKDVYPNWSKVYTMQNVKLTKITVGWRSVFSKSLYISGKLSANDLINGNGNVHALYYVKKMY